MLKSINLKSFFMISVVLILFSQSFTSCKKDDDSSDDKGLKITKENVMGTWVNVDKGITLVISESGAIFTETGKTPRSCSWGIGTNTLIGDYVEISQGLFVRSYRLKTKTSLLNISNDNILTKQ
jgi:hypothetical protein